MPENLVHNEKIYQKLIRDKIPEIMDSKGTRYEIRTLEHEEYIVTLQNKLQEELNELLQTSDKDSWIEEMADLYEVMLSLLKAKNLSLEDLEAVRKQKQQKRGGFEKRLFLEKTFEAVTS